MNKLREMCGIIGDGALMLLVAIPFALLILCLALVVAHVVEKWIPP